MVNVHLYIISHRDQIQTYEEGVGVGGIVEVGVGRMDRGGRSMCCLHLPHLICTKTDSKCNLSFMIIK